MYTYFISRQSCISAEPAVDFTACEIRVYKQPFYCQVNNFFESHETQLPKLNHYAE